MADDELDGIKRGWGKRLLSTGKIAASAARLAARRAVGASPGDQDGRLGEALAHELDQMKGMAMKVGQIVSYFDGILPEQAHAALHSLQRGAKPVAFENMAAVVEQAFGQPVDALFDELDRDPIAAASIGQVYRARFRGEPVAVKVQYPGIRDTMDADFGRLDALSRIASLATAVDGAAIVRELQARIHEECDYLREAAHQTAFAHAFSSDPDVLVPEVVPERTREMVLTTAWATGVDFYTFAARSPQARRDAVGQVLGRFAFTSLYALGTLNADPHPGNYLFPDDGRVVFLDFGCVRRFDADFLAAQRRLTEVVIGDHRARFDEALLATGMVPKPDRFDFDHHWALMCHELSPYRSPRFRFTTEWLRRGMEFSRPGAPNVRVLSIPPQWIWLERLIWGLHAVLARLDAEGPFGDLIRAALALPTQPLAIE